MLATHTQEHGKTHTLTHTLTHTDHNTTNRASCSPALLNTGPNAQEFYQKMASHRSYPNPRQKCIDLTLTPHF